MSDFIETLDDHFYDAFPTNHPTTHAYVLMKMELMRLRRESSRADRAAWVPERVKVLERMRDERKFAQGEGHAMDSILRMELEALDEAIAALRGKGGICPNCGHPNDPLWAEKAEHEQRQKDAREALEAK